MHGNFRYHDICNPQVKNGWEKLNQSLELLSSFKCRSVIRITCVDGYNMKDPEGYAQIIRESNPDFVEIKAYMFVGSSRERLKLDNMPKNDDVHDFAQSISVLCGKKIVNQSPESRVFLLA